MNFPKTKLQWLWENMKGYHAIYILGILGTILYNFMQLTVPYVSQEIVDRFLTGAGATDNLKNHRDLLFWLLAAMVLLTLLRTSIVYTVCMAYEHCSQSALFRIRNYLFNKIERQDMKF